MKPFDGDMDDYRRLVLEGTPSSDPDRRDAARNIAQDRRRAAAEQRESTAPLRKKIKETESLMEKLHKEIQQIDARLADPSLYDRKPADAAKLAKQRSDAEKALQQNEEQWLALSADFERANADTG